MKIVEYNLVYIINYFIIAMNYKSYQMETDNLSPEKSFELITQVINEARNKFEENGFIYMFWGALIAIASLSQFVLLKNEYYSIHFYPYFLMPLGGIFTGYYFSKKKKSNHNQISKMVSTVWIVLSINMMILGFVFATVLKESLIPVILILQGVGMVISGGAVKSKLLMYAGIAVNISGFVCFSLDWIYHPLLAGCVALFAIMVPGIILMVKYKKEQHV